MDRMYKGQKQAAASFFAHRPTQTTPTAPRPNPSPAPVQQYAAPPVAHMPMPAPSVMIPKPMMPRALTPMDAFLASRYTAPRPNPTPMPMGGGGLGMPTAGFVNPARFLPDMGMQSAPQPQPGPDGLSNEYLLNTLGQQKQNITPGSTGLGVEGGGSPGQQIATDPQAQGRITWGHERDRAINQGNQIVTANEARMAEIDSEIETQLANQDAYTQANPNWGADGSTVISESQAAITALESEYTQLQQQSNVIRDAQALYSGDTYQGRAAPDWGFGSLGEVGTTALNVLDAGRETAVTEIGDQAIAAINDRTLDVPPVAPQPDTSDSWIDPLGNTINSVFGGIAPGRAPISSDASDRPAPDPNYVPTETEIKEADTGWFLNSWLRNGGEARQNQAQRVYAAGYDVNGDGYIDYTGGRAVWEWYIGQQPWYVSAVSQIIYDPLNVTIVFSGAAGVLGKAAEVANVAGDVRLARVLGTTAKVLDTISHADDPLWWAYSLPKSGLGRLGRGIGILDPATGEVIRTTDKTIDEIAATARDTGAFTSQVATPSDKMPIHTPIKANGTTMTQVGNSGMSWIGINSDGTYTVYTQGVEGGRFSATATGLTQDEALAQAKEAEQVLVGSMYLSGDPRLEGKAAVYDRPTPIKFTNNPTGVIAVVGNGQLQVLFDPGSNRFALQTRNGTTIGIFDNLDSTLDAAEVNYAQSGGALATQGGFPTAYTPQLPNPTSPQVSPGATGTGPLAQPIDQTPGQQINPTGAASPGGINVGTVPLPPATNAEVSPGVTGSGPLGEGPYDSPQSGLGRYGRHPTGETSAVLPGGQNVGTVSAVTPEVSPGTTGQGPLGATAGPTGQPIDETGAASPGGANVGTVPLPGATSPEVSPPTGEGPIGGSRTTAQAIGEATDTAAANVSAGQVENTFNPVVKEVEQQVPVNTATGKRAPDTRTGERTPDTRTGSRSEVAPASASDEAASTARVLSDNPATDIPPSTISEQLPASAGTAPSGTPGMYRQTITNPATGQTAVDFSPPKLWSDAAATVVARTLPESGVARQIVMDWIQRNPKVQAAQREFYDALQSGDEIDQALAAMEMRVAMGEAWIDDGMSAQYGPVFGGEVSPGSAGLSMSSAPYPQEFPKTGRAIERIASGRGTPNDIGNLRRTGVLPHTSGVDPDLLRDIDQFRIDRYAASARGENFILPDGRNRLFSSQYQPGGQVTPQELRQLLSGPGLDRSLNTMRRLEGIKERFRSLNHGIVRDPAELERMLDSEMARYGAPNAVQRSKGDTARRSPDVDTRTSKQNVEAMDVKQAKVRTGKSANAPTDIDFRAMKKSGRRSDEFHNSIPNNADEAGYLYNEGRLREIDPTARYDLISVTLPSNHRGFMLRSETGELIGWGKTVKELMNRIGVERDEVPFLRIFKDGVQLPVAKSIKDPARLRELLIEANDGQAINGVLKVVKDYDGQYHLVVEDSFGVRRGIFNTYDSVPDAAAAVQRAAQKGGLDWTFYGPDGEPLFKGKGAGGLGFANVPIDPRQAAAGARYVGSAATEQVNSLRNRLGAKRGRSAVPNPKDDGTFAGNLFDSGAIDEKGYQILTKTYLKEGREVVVQDQVLARMLETGDLTRAMNEVLDEAIGVKKTVAIGNEAKKGTKSALGGAYDAVNDVYRANLLYAVHRTIPGLLADWVGDTFIHAMNGHGLSGVTELAKDVLRVGDGSSIFNAVRKGEWDAVEAVHPLFIHARANGVAIDINDFAEVSKFGEEVSGTRDMPLSRGLQKVGVPKPVANVITTPLQSRLARDLRNSGDAVRRLGIARTQYDRELLTARSEVMDQIDKIAKATGADRWDMRAKFRALGEDVNVTKVREAFPDNLELARLWKSKTTQIKTNTMNAVKKLTFVGGKTKADEALGKVMFFHYWTTRALALHAETALKNPALIRLYAESYEYTKEHAEELGLPGYMQTYLRFIGSENGWMGYINPLGLLVPMFMFTDFVGADEFDRSIGDYINDFGAMSPWILGALGATGLLSRAPDVTGTLGLRNIARAVINWSRANGYGPIDQYVSPAGDPIDSLQDDFFNWLSKNFGEKYIPGGKEIEQIDPRDTDLRQLNMMVDERMEELYGSDWRDDPALVQEANDAKQAGETGDPGNAVWDYVYKQWTRDKVFQAGMKALTPGSAQFIYGPQQAQRKLANEGYDALDRGEQPTSEQQAAMDAIRENGLRPEGREVNLELDAYYDIGTTFQRELSKVRNDLVYNPEIVPDGSNVVIDDTEHYTSAEWNALTQEERQDAMDRWVDAQGGTEQLQAYRDAREAYRTEHPEVDGYMDWREAAYDNPEAVHEEMMRISPAYADYINGLDNPDDPDDWWSIQAYYASVGQEYKMSDNPEDPMNPSMVNPMQQITGYQTPDSGGEFTSTGSSKEKPTYGTGQWATETEWRQNAPDEYVAAMQAEYDQSLTDAQPVVDDVLRANGYDSMVGMTYQEIADQAAAKGTSKAYDTALKAIKNEMYLLDIKVPSLDGEVKDYDRWKADTLAADPNADVSQQAYAQVKAAGQEKYGVNEEERAAGDQTQQNQALADWWAANPDGRKNDPTYPGDQPITRYIPDQGTRAAARQTLSGPAASAFFSSNTFRN